MESDHFSVIVKIYGINIEVHVNVNDRTGVNYILVSNYMNHFIIMIIIKFIHQTHSTGIGITVIIKIYLSIVTFYLRTNTNVPYNCLDHHNNSINL